MSLLPLQYRIAIIGFLLAIGAAGLFAYGHRQYTKGVTQGRAEVQAKWDAKERSDAAIREADAREQIKFSDKAAGNHAATIATLNTQLGAANEKIARLSGRDVLSPLDVSMLNATGVLDRATAANNAASAPAAAASGSGLRYSTDRDLAGYIALCRTRYAEVADQLNKILDIEDKRWPAK